MYAYKFPIALDMSSKPSIWSIEIILMMMLIYFVLFSFPVFCI